MWSNWKNDGCPEFQPSVSLRANANSDEAATDGINGEKKTGVVAGRQRRLKRPLGDQIREASKRNKLVIGKYETIFHF